MKKLIIPSSNDLIKNSINLIDGVIVGIEDLSVNMPIYFNVDNIEEVISLCKSNNKQVFISLNKNMVNNDLEYLKEVMIKLDKLKVDGILYYDISIVNIKEELKLDVDLVWNQCHMTTNYLTGNFWYMYGARYMYISSEITKEEINEIDKNGNFMTMVNIFGYLPMFNSKRHLVKNYLEKFNLKDNSKFNYIEKENNKYLILDTKHGTVSYSSKVLNGIEDMLEINTDYVVLNSFMIDDDKFLEVLKYYNDVNESNVLEYKERIDSMFSTDTYFLRKETIYKVK